MRNEDIPAGVGLCRHASWNQLQGDWETILRLSPQGCLVAENDGEVVGTASTIRYGQAFSWIGMVLVHPSFKRQGIGKTLLTRALDLLIDQDTLKLDATPQGRELYLQLDFKDEYRLSRMTGNPVAVQDFNSSCFSLKEDVFSEIAACDKSAFGADRGELLKQLLERAPQYAFYCRQDGKISGYCLGRNGHRYTQIGPVVADSIATAQQLVEAATQMTGERHVVLDVLHQPGWSEWIESKGFREERPFIRMFRGSNNFQGSVSRQFAIAGPEFG